MITLTERIFGRIPNIWLATKNVLFFTSDVYHYHNLWSCQKVCDAIVYLLDNIFIRFGTKLYRQTIGIPMGTNCAPFICCIFVSFLLWEWFHDVSLTGKLSFQFNFKIPWWFIKYIRSSQSLQCGSFQNCFICFCQWRAISRLPKSRTYASTDISFVQAYGMVGEACLPSNAYYPRTPDYTLCSGVHVCWSEHSDSSFVYGFMSLDYGFGTMTATTNIDNIYFDQMVDRIYPTELQLNRANSSDTEAPFLDLNLCISNGTVSTKIYDKRDDFDFDIVKFPFSGWRCPPAYLIWGIYISQFIRFARASSNLSDFNCRNKALTDKLLRQGYRYFKLRKAFSKFYRRHSALVEKYSVSLKTLLQQCVNQLCNMF